MRESKFTSLEGYIVKRTEFPTQCGLTTEVLIHFHLDNPKDYNIYFIPLTVYTKITILIFLHILKKIRHYTHTDAFVVKCFKVY